MEIVSRKRLRSDESPFILQQKIHVNEKIVNSSDVTKMKKIHDKTLQLLFKAARSLNDNSALATKTKTPPHEHILLSGNGLVQARHEPFNVHTIEKKELHKVVCCSREAFIEAECKNCQGNLCEYCGYSCAECFEFLCNLCVSVFDCGNVERPICKNCSLYD